MVEGGECRGLFAGMMAFGAYYTATETVAPPGHPAAIITQCCGAAALTSGAARRSRLCCGGFRKIRCRFGRHCLNTWWRSLAG